MRRSLIATALCLAMAAPAVHAAQEGSFDKWPVSFDTGNGNVFSFTGNFAYDYNDFSGDSRLEDKDFMRRKEFGATLKKDGVYDAMVYFDFQTHTWLDVYLRMETKALFGKDVGKIRVGYIKTPVGMDGLTASRSVSMQELSLPNQAFYAGRRTGVEWSQEKPHWFAQVGAYGGKDLQGDNPGTMQAARFVWNPIKGKDEVIHLGLAASVENPRGWQDGLGVSHPAQVRFRSRPEAGLTDIRLIDSGALLDADHIVRTGLEGAWSRGPLYLQGEALNARVSRSNGQPDYQGNGQYAQLAWALTGESHPYAGGVFSNIKPTHGYGAVELLARYSRLDLDDGSVEGGRQHDWTFGANWYLTTHFKFQANYVRANATRAGVHTTPDIVELRAQVQF